MAPVKTPDVKGTAGSWSPIDSVPPEVKADGRDVLVALLPGGRQVVAHWDGAAWVADGPVAPTHWQPLGPLPDVTEEPVAKEPVAKEPVAKKEKEEPPAKEAKDEKEAKE
jgi:hypothetical protein